MVLHYLYRADIFVADTVGGDAVFSAEEVGTFNIKFVDILALILYFAALGHIYAGHTFQHVADGAILCLSEAADTVRDGIALFANAVGLDSDLFKQCCSRLHIDS